MAKQTTKEKGEKKEEKTSQKEVSEQSSPSQSTEEKPLSKEDQKEVRVIERIIESREVEPQDAFGKLSRPQIQLIKNTVAKGASDDELRLFIQVCKGAKLNPFLRQVHLVPRWDSRLAKEVRTIQVGIDGFRAVAESSGQYAGNDDPTYEGTKTIEYGKDKTSIEVPETSTVTVYKLMEGTRMPFTATARWDEYYPGERMGFQWHIRPYLMLGKCAEALALRKAFPKLLSGMYAQEEMDRTLPKETSEKRAKAASDKLWEMIAEASEEELHEYRKKVEASKKYTAEQKKEFIESIDKRLANIAEAAQSEG